MRTVPCLILLLAAVPAFAPAAIAQSSFGGPGGAGLGSGAPKAPRPTRDTTPPPVAVPGARARPDSVAPAAPGAADLPPTEALFDSINRGDILTARDAITRGADLDGTNLLGLTPLELSVDLGRNDISFLLLSLRGGGDSSGGSAHGPGPAVNPDAAPATAAQRRQTAAAARAEARAQQAAAQAERAKARVQTPALFAGNGGAAVPSAGFLGFDPHR